MWGSARCNAEMPKRLLDANRLTKAHSSNHPSTNTYRRSRKEQGDGQSQVGVAERLERLRLESSRHSHNRSTGTVPRQIDSVSAHPGMAHPEIASLLGESLPVIPRPRKSQHRGFAAPLSWSVRPRTDESEHVIPLGGAIRKQPWTLVYRTIRVIAEEVDVFMGCGMHYLPEHLKQLLLDMLHTLNSPAILNELYPDRDEQVVTLDMTGWNMGPHALKPLLSRVPNLQRIHLTAYMLEGIYQYLPRILKFLDVRGILPTLNLNLISKYFINVKELRIHAGQQKLHCADWAGSWRTVKVVWLDGRADADRVIEFRRAVTESRSGKLAWIDVKLAQDKEIT